MIYGHVVGNVWATRKDPRIEGLPLLVVERCAVDGTPQQGFVVAVDTVSAGVGDKVLVAQGSSARQTDATRDRPVDAVIMAIVDDLSISLGRQSDERRSRQHSQTGSRCT